MSLSADDLVSKHSFAVFIAYLGIVLSYGLLLGKYIDAWPIILFTITHQVTALFIVKRCNLIPYTLALLISLFAIAFAGFFHFQFVLFIFTALFLPSFFKYIWEGIRKFSWINTILLVAMSALFSLSSFNRIFDNNYRVPGALVNPASLTLTSMDTYFHTSIANMISNFSVISTGVDGLTPLGYHALSHWLYSGITSFLSLNNLEFYSLYSGIFIVPLLWISLLSLTFSLNKNIFDIKFIALFFSAFYLFNSISHPAIPRAPVMWGSELISDSYTVSLILLIGLMDYLFTFDPLEEPSHFTSLFIFIALTSHAKISSGTTAIAIANLFVFARLLNRFSFKNFLLFSFFGALTLIFIYFMISRGGGASAEQFSYHFWKTYLATNQLKQVEFLYNYLWVLLLLLLIAINRTRIKRSLLLQMALILIVVFAINEIPGQFFAIPGGSAYYFSNIFKQISFPFFFILGLGIFSYQVMNYLFGLMVIAVYSICMRHTQLLAFYSAEKIATKKEEASFTLLKTLESYPQKYVYISKANLLWKLGDICNKNPFWGPALTGKIFINNIHQNCTYKWYGFTEIKNKPIMAVDETTSGLCKKLFEVTSAHNTEMIKVNSDDRIEVIRCL